MDGRSPPRRQFKYVAFSGPNLGKIKEITWQHKNRRSGGSLSLYQQNRSVPRLRIKNTAILWWVLINVCEHMAVISCLWCGSAPKLHWNTGAGWSQVSSYGLSYPPVTCLPDTLALFRIMTEILTNSHSDEISCCCCPTHNWWHHSLEPSQEKHLFHRGVLLSHVKQSRRRRIKWLRISSICYSNSDFLNHISSSHLDLKQHTHNMVPCVWCQSPETFYKYCKEPFIPVWLCSKT